MFHGQGGSGRHLHNLLGDTADEGVFESTSTVGGHHDQIDVFVACVLHDLNMGRTDSQRGHDVDLTDRFSQLDQPFFGVLLQAFENVAAILRKSDASRCGNPLCIDDVQQIQ